MSNKSQHASQDGDTANFSGLPHISHREGETWTCRVCKYRPNLDTVSPQCVGCGRDFWGNPGERPANADLIQHARESGVG